MNNNFPDHARLWVYAANRALTPEESAAIEENAKQFARSWQSHGTPMVADANVLHNQFLVLIADETNVATGGCSMDNSVHFIKELEKAYQVDFMDRMLFHSYHNNKVVTYDRNSLNEGYSHGVITDETLFFNTLVKTYGEYKKNWLVPLKESWVKRMLMSASIDNS